MWTSVGEIGRPLYIARTYLMSLFQKNDDGDDDRDEIGPNYHLHGQEIFSVSFIQRRRKNLGLHFKNSTNNLEIIKKKPNYHLFKSSKYI